MDKNIPLIIQNTSEESKKNFLEEDDPSYNSTNISSYLNKNTDSILEENKSDYILINDINNILMKTFKTPVLDNDYKIKRDIMTNKIIYRNKNIKEISNDTILPLMGYIIISICYLLIYSSLIILFGIGLNRIVTSLYSETSLGINLIILSCGLFAITIIHSISVRLTQYTMKIATMNKLEYFNKIGPELKSPLITSLLLFTLQTGIKRIITSMNPDYMGLRD